MPSINLNLVINILGIATLIGVIYIIILLLAKMEEVKQLNTSLNKLRRAFDELDEQAKLIVKTDLALNKTQDELDKKITGLYTLHKISRLISTTFDENEIFRRIDESLITDLGFEKNLIFIFDRSHNLICKMEGEHTKVEIEKIQLTLTKEHIFSPLMQKAKPLSSFNTDTHSQSKISQLFGVNYFVLAPIITQDGIAGIIFAGNKSGYSLLTEGDEELITILATQIGQSLENARLFEQVYHSQQELENKVTLRTKELAQALEDVRRISKMKSDFVSAVSHELRTPLTSIKGYASILMSGKLGEMPVQVKDRLDKINKHTDSLVQLINDLLDISRIESGRVEMKFEFHSIDQIAEAVADLLSLQLKEKKVNLSLDIPKEIKPVFIDVSQIQRVFVNLVNNAIKFTPANGKIAVKVLDAGEYIQIDISDTGIGIGENDIDKIFEEFYRVDNAVNQSLQGSGLGLSLVKRIVEAHQGKMWVKSKVSQGTTFSFTLPKRTP